MRLFVVAGEASGDALGAALLDALSGMTEVELAGVGGPLMAAQGLSSLFPMEELSVMGLMEILPRYPALRRRMIQTADAAAAFAPDVLLTIDSPEFGLRVARRVRSARPGQRTVHYVAPSVWAWRPGRAARMAEVIDHVLALLPFEPPYMEAAGMGCDFVGHPIAAKPPVPDAEVRAFLTTHAAHLDGPVLSVLPGSRGSEISRLGPVFGEAIGRIGRPVVPVLPVASGKRHLVEGVVRDWPVEPVLIDGGDEAVKRAAFAASSAALAASGTVSLELAQARTPMAIAYDMAPLSRFVTRRLLKVRTVTLVNLVSETEAVPEFLGERCRPDPIAACLDDLLANGSPDQEMAMATTMRRLGEGGEPPGLRAARALLSVSG